MEMYQHDSAAMFRFELRGDLSGTSVRDFEYAWKTARSIATRKEMVADLSGITNIDAAGVELLSRMRASGVRVIALRAEPQAIPAMAGADSRGGWVGRLRQFWRSRCARGWAW